MIKLNQMDLCKRKSIKILPKIQNNNKDVRWGDPTGKGGKKANKFKTCFFTRFWWTWTLVDNRWGITSVVKGRKGRLLLRKSVEWIWFQNFGTCKGVEYVKVWMYWLRESVKSKNGWNVWITVVLNGGSGGGYPKSGSKLNSNGCGGCRCSPNGY